MKPFLRAQLERFAQRLSELDFLLSREDIMQDMSQFLVLSREHTELTASASRYARYQQRESDLQAAQQMLQDSGSDNDLREMAQEEVASAEAELVQLEAELQRMLLPKDPDDERTAYLEIRAGTGGDESALFAGDLFRMYSRYADARGWQVEVLSQRPGEHGGFKEIILSVQGKGAWSRLKFERGVHRVQRVPETEQQGRVHTSAVTVAVMPEADEVEVNINPEDLRIDIYHSSGHGGQNVQKVATAVWTVHSGKEKTRGDVAMACPEETRLARHTSAPIQSRVRPSLHTARAPSAIPATASSAAERTTTSARSRSGVRNSAWCSL